MSRYLRISLLGLLLLALVTGAGGWAYARRQVRVAREALAADRPQEARDRLAFPLAVLRWDVDVHVLAARAARLSGDLPAAEGHLKRSLQLADGATEAVQLEFLLLRVQTGELDEVAPALIEVADKGHPEAALILSTLAVAYMNNLRYKPAFACLSRWIELHPDAAKAYQYRGWVLEGMNKHKAALDEYHKALELDPESFPVRLRIAEMLVADHQPQEALPYLEQLYRQAPDDPLVQARLGMCRVLQNRAGEPRRLMEAAAVWLPNDPTLQISLARLDLQEGRAAEAERRLRAVIQADPADAEALHTLLGAVQAQGKTDEAVTVLRQHERAKAVLERTHKLLQEVADSRNASAADYAELGELFLGMKQEKRGLYWLYEALERDPELQQAHRVLVAYYEQKHNADKAAAHRRRLRQPDARSGGAAPSSR
jgi:tetratricopeptide (TPR) repeat protein